MKKTLLLVMMLCATALYARINQAQRISALKKRSLAICLYDNYMSLDSTFRAKMRDHSLMLFSAESMSSIFMYDTIAKFTETNTDFFYKNPPFDNYEDAYGNQILYQCLCFYESKELDQFIRKAIKDEDKREIERIKEAKKEDKKREMEGLKGD